MNPAERARAAMAEAQSGPMVAITPARTIDIFAAAIAAAEQAAEARRFAEEIEASRAFMRMVVLFDLATLFWMARTERCLT